MQFNSYFFIMAFLPAIILIYFLSNKLHILAGKIVLILGSLIFYAYSDKKMLFFLCASIAINYIFTLLIQKMKWKKIFLSIPIIINAGLLLYFKYLNFVIENINSLLKTNYILKDLILPIGISFFTFQQIAYLVSVYRKELKNNYFVDYLTYILYFPKLLMGPLAEPTDFIEQINNPDTKKINWDHIAEGLKIFSFGLFKKVLLADTFANAVYWGYTYINTATSIDWFLIMLSYTFEIYFDFSGYSDMAVGISRMLNITLPMNFDSPYKAISIRDFWKRWHISLTKFLTKYIYIPLGGSRKGKVLTYINTMIVFLVSGIWHGANWTFILWGALHGTLSILDRIFENTEKKLIEPVRWFFTFTGVNLLWLLFSASSVKQWISILKTMFSFQNTTISEGLISVFKISESALINQVFHLDDLNANVRGLWLLLFFIMAYGICLIPENNYKKLSKLSATTMILASIACVWGILCLSMESVFVYFNF